MSRRAPLWVGLGLIAGGLVVLVISAAVGGAGPVTTPVADLAVPGLGIMGAGPLSGRLPGPGSVGFVAGTVAVPRVVPIVATPQLRFVPDTVIVKQGETITFEVTSLGPLSHEFMVGPAGDVAADKPGTPEVADLAMMQTRSLTYTFDGPGPYAYACHVAGHYEAGMVGTIELVP